MNVKMRNSPLFLDEYFKGVMACQNENEASQMDHGFMKNSVRFSTNCVSFFLSVTYGRLNNTPFQDTPSECPNIEF